MTQHPKLGRVAGKVALVTGAAQGMGAAHARMLADEGASVVLADVLAEQGENLAADIGADRAAFVHLDVTDEEAWRTAVAATTERFGGLDVLVNNAGIFTRGSVENASVADWRRTIDINLTGSFLGMHASVSALRSSRGASIINVSSIAGLAGFKNRAAYSAAKWGLRGLTQTSALDLGPSGIRVNSIHPGSVRTPLTADLVRGFSQIPLGHDAEPEDVSNLVVFLASDESRFMTGSCIAIDGGESAGNHLREDS